MKSVSVSFLPPFSNDRRHVLYMVEHCLSIRSSQILGVTTCRVLFRYLTHGTSNDVHGMDGFLYDHCTLAWIQAKNNPSLEYVNGRGATLQKSLGMIVHSWHQSSRSTPFLHHLIKGYESPSNMTKQDNNVY